MDFRTEIEVHYNLIEAVTLRNQYIGNKCIEKNGIEIFISVPNYFLLHKTQEATKLKFTTVLAVN